MRRRFLCLLLLFPVLAFAQQTEQEKKLMETWGKLAAPGEHHKHIAQFQGNWSVAIKYRLIPTGEVRESSGSCEKKVVLGGRYLSEHCTTRSTKENKTTEGLGILGYDNYKKNYLSTWMSSDSTMVNPLYGTCDGKGKTITVTGTYVDPVSGKERKSTWSWTIVDPNKHTLKVLDTDPEGKDNRTVEAIYIRNG